MAEAQDNVASAAELVVVNGSRAGARVDISQGEVFIGRAPGLALALPEPDVAWRHCQIRRQGTRYLITDLRTSVGTYVNGMRSTERWLEDRDQISIGHTTLLFRLEAGDEVSTPDATSGGDSKPVLLAACSLVFLARALAAADDETQSRVVQNQILRLVSDQIPVAESHLLLAPKLADLSAELEKRSTSLRTEMQTAIEKVCQEGAFADAQTGIAGVPLYLHNVLGGALLLKIPGSESAKTSEHLETLTAVASLVSIGFEAYQEVEVLKAENARLQEQIATNAGIVGNSPPIRRLLQLVDRVAPRDTTVLITGESGTGKELIARALHQKSARREHPFIAVNCAALSESLFESELFGHEKGAFTGAIALKRGRFEMANGGSIFLDEVGELALGLQAKLLRVLQQREFERVGGTQVYPLDIRLIAATNRDLGEEVKQGKFREDLFHRLNVVNLDSPPLRDRSDDIPVLADYFLQRSAQRCKREVEGLSAEAAEMVSHYAWPGNVRELENAMERAVVLGVSAWVLPEDLPDNLLEAAPRDSGTRYHHSVGQAKREAIVDAYVQGSGDYKQAAKVLGIHPNYLLRLVRNLNLRDEINRAVAGTSGSSAGR